MYKYANFKIYFKNILIPITIKYKINCKPNIKRNKTGVYSVQNMHF